ncbi:hypothetical protein [Sphingobacterium suaedae]|uniref:Uncharacterized protein n=1 Tax=Sphingobacterium suaedae TaxID=1686402 RepID=A0ABW5KJF5_9SPHI
MVRIHSSPQPLQIADMVLTALGDIKLETVDFMDSNRDTDMTGRV